MPGLRKWWVVATVVVLLAGPAHGQEEAEPRSWWALGYLGGGFVSVRTTMPGDNDESISGTGMKLVGAGGILLKSRFGLGLMTSATFASLDDDVSSRTIIIGPGIFVREKRLGLFGGIGLDFSKVTVGDEDATGKALGLTGSVSYRVVSIVSVTAGAEFGGHAVNPSIYMQATVGLSAAF